MLEQRSMKKNQVLKKATMVAKTEFLMGARRK